MCLGYSGGSPGKQQKKEESFPCLPSGSLESSSTLLLLLLHPFTDVGTLFQAFNVDYMQLTLLKSSRRLQYHVKTGETSRLME